MVRSRLVALVATTVCALVGVSTASAAAPPAPFHSKGRWLTDSSGRVYITSGVNMVYKRPPYAPSATGFDEDDAQFLEDNGIDSVRLGIIWKAVEPQPGVYDDAYLDNVRATTEMLSRHGIATLIDAHQDLFNEKFQGEFAPDWAVLDKGLPSWPQIGFPWSYFVNLGLMASLDSFLYNEPGPGGIGLQDRFAAMWAHVATRFDGTPGVLGYDIVNELQPGFDWSQCFGDGYCPRPLQGMGNLHRKVGAAIRATGVAGIVMYEPFAISGSNFGTKVSPAAVSDQALSFHSYCPLASITNIQFGCDGIDADVMGQAEAAAKRDGAGMLLTEWGATNGIDILQAMVGLASKSMVGHQYWAYCPCADPTTASQEGQGVVLDPALPPSGANLRADKIQILGAPHPRYIAGTPLSYGFNRGSKTFRMTYSTAKVGGGTFPARSRTVVSTPLPQYPAGYTVTVSGAVVISAANAPELVLRSKAGATQVSVTVKPRGPVTAPTTQATTPQPAATQPAPVVTLPTR